MNFEFIQLLWLINIIALSGLGIYGIHRMWFVLLWYKHHRWPSVTIDEPALSSFPKVTIQLPLYNERFVAERLINAAANLDWPRQCLEIQVLDDSTDDTREIVERRAQFWREKGICINVIHRKDRSGFKAGALANGLNEANGEFVAVFDADFVPPKDFLTRTVPYFSNSAIGMVQCRWNFFNEDYSWFTRIQSLLLASHFRIEHYVRFKEGLFFNFNGTAGIWRKCAITSSGGWQSDTVTEDIDLSYRAQLAGWRFIYLDDYTVPSELPATLSAFRRQQQRWAKGSIQTARKLLPTIISSRRISLKVKLEAAAHLLANLGWIFCSLLTLTLYPVALVDKTGIFLGGWRFVSFFLFYSSIGILIYFIFYALVSRSRAIFWLWLLPVISVGIAPALSLTVVSGMFKKGGTFYRTPKYGILGRSNSVQKISDIYRSIELSNFLINIPFLIYTTFQFLLLWQLHAWAVVLQVLFPLGFCLVIFNDIEDLLKGKKI